MNIMTTKYYKNSFHLSELTSLLLEFNVVLLFKRCFTGLFCLTTVQSGLVSDNANIPSGSQCFIFL